MIRIAFQGFKGAYSESAAKELFGPSSRIETVGHASFEACFEAVTKGDCLFAMLPMENTMGGSVVDNFDLQLKYQLHAVAELNKRVQHALLAMPGTRKQDLKLVASHPQALSQCAHYMETSLPWAKPQVETDTAGSAKKIAEEKLATWGAICSKDAAQVYGLQVLDEDVQDAKDNITRFLLYAKTGCDASRVMGDVQLKCSIVFTISNHAGALHDALGPFAKHSVNLTKLESRPDRRRGVASETLRDPGALGWLFGQGFLKDLPAYVDDLQQTVVDEGKFKAMFFLDFIVGPGTRQAIRELALMCPFLRVLGVYAAGGPLLDHVAKVLGVAEGTSFARQGVTAKPSAGNNNSSTDASSSSSSPAKMPRVAEPVVSLTIAIVGFGNFGQFLARQMKASGHKMVASSRADYSSLARTLGVEFFADAARMLVESKPDVVLIATSILSFQQVVAQLPIELLRGRLVVDVLSVKVHARKTMLNAWEDEAKIDILCTHPMFGPESGRFSWRGLPFVYEKTRVQDARRCDAFVEVFRQAGCKMIEMACEEHDAKAANSQFVTHFTGRSLAELGLKATGIDTKGFASLLELVDNTVKDSDDLFLALYRHNPSAAATLDALHLAVDGVSARLRLGDEPDAFRLAASLGRIEPSKTVKTHALAMDLKRQGKDVITTLTVGEPHFGPPEEALKAAEMCLRSKTGTKYTAVGGTPDIKKNIALDYSKRKHVSYNPDTQILVSGGGKQSVYQAILSLCGPGDEVVVPAPYWVSYPDIVRLAGAKPVIVHRAPELGYILQAQQLRQSLNKRTRILILNNPCNPTGCLYTKTDLENIASVLREPQFQHVLVVSDEIYERIVYDHAEHVTFASLPGMYDRTLMVNGVAKGFAMTGMRIGWLCGPTVVVKACEKLQGQISSCASSVSQAAAAAALPLDPKVAGPGAKNLNELRDNRELAFSLLGEIKGLTAVKGGGAFYAFCSLTRPDGRPFGLSGEELCERMIRRERGVALVPGEAFGSKPEACAFRMSYAAEPEDVRQGVLRIREFVEEWNNKT